MAAVVKKCSRCDCIGHNIKKCPIIELEKKEAEKELARKKEMEIAAIKKERDDFMDLSVDDRLLVLYNIIKDNKHKIDSLEESIEEIKFKIRSDDSY